MSANPVQSQATQQVETPPADSVARSVRVVQIAPSDAAAEPPWPEQRRDPELQWESFMRFLGPLEAQILAGLGPNDR